MEPTTAPARRSRSASPSDRDSGVGTLSTVQAAAMVGLVPARLAELAAQG